MQKKSSHRPQRIGDQIKRELAQLIQFEIKDPRLSTVTIIDVEMSKDLSNAKVFFSTLHENDAPDALKAFKIATGFLRKQIGSLMDLRIVPQLNFIYDESIIKGQKLSALIDEAVAKDADEHKKNKQDAD